jgi:SHS2 domain-containing protein
MADRPRYVFLDHTADAEFQAFGDSLELALVNAALATAALMWDWSTVGRSLARPVSVEGRDLIYLFGREGFLLASVDDLRVEEEEGRWRLGAVFRGEISSDKHRLRGEVKAITYNDLRIERNGGVMIQVVVDV